MLVGETSTNAHRPNEWHARTVRTALAGHRAGPESSPAPTVLIVDDHELVGTSLAYSLSAEGLDARRAAAVDVAGVLADAATSPVGLALLDLDLGRDRSGRRFDGVDLVAPLTERGWRCIVLSSTVDRTRIGAALAAGALAAVPKHAPLPLLLSKLRAALAGLPVMSPETRQRLIDSHLVRDAERRQIAEKLERLTRREREVLAELAVGTGHRPSRTSTSCPSRRCAPRSARC